MLRTDKKIKWEFGNTLIYIRYNNDEKTDITLDCKRIDIEGARRFSEDVLNSQITSHIKFEGSNPLGENGAIAIAEMLKENTTVTDLDLSNNEIGDNGAIAIAEMLKDNITITDVNFSSNPIERLGGLAIADMIKISTSITHINFEDTAIYLAGKEVIKAFEENDTITHANFEDTELNHDHAIAIADMIKKNSTIRHLNISDNSIDNEGFLEISKALEVNTTIESIKTDYNCHSEEGTMAINEAVKNNKLRNVSRLNQPAINQLRTAVTEDIDHSSQTQPIKPNVRQRQTGQHK